MGTGRSCTAGVEVECDKIYDYEQDFTRYIENEDDEDTE